jgi:hypothetical protein
VRVEKESIVEERKKVDDDLNLVNKQVDGKRDQGRDSPKLVNVAPWQLLNQLGSNILLRFLFCAG